MVLWILAYLAAVVLAAKVVRWRLREIRTVRGHLYRDRRAAQMARAALRSGAMMQMAVQTQAPAAGQAAGRPQPQTTVEQPGGPFIRHAQAGRAPQYTYSNVAFGGLVTQPLVARPGYYRGFRVTISATGGVNGTTTVALVASGDGIFACVSLVQLKDSFGTVLIVAPGFETLYLIPLFSGAFGLGISSDVSLLPSYTAASVGAAGTGNFQFSSYLPFEFAKAYGVNSGANASLQPTLQFNYAASASVYSAAPGTLPVLNAQVDSDFYWLPTGSEILPPGLGSSRQWVLQQCATTIASGATVRTSFPRLGGYIDTIILIARNTSGLRSDIWPGFASQSLSTPGARLQIYVDGVALIDSTIGEILDDMQIVNQWTPVSTTGNTPNVTGGNMRPVGVLAFSRKTSLNQVNNGLFETGETFLSTNPGTLLEVQGAPWGTFATGPAQLNVLIGQIVPTGNLVTGLPEI